MLRKSITVTKEKDKHVIANEIPIIFFRVKLKAKIKRSCTRIMICSAYITKGSLKYHIKLLNTYPKNIYY